MTPPFRRLLCGLSLLLFTAPAWGQPAIVKSANSGDWSAPTTWQGGKVPAAGSKVHVQAGHVVRYDANSTQVIRSVHLDGTLTFATDRDTRLEVGLIRVNASGTTDEEGFDCNAHL